MFYISIILTILFLFLLLHSVLSYFSKKNIEGLESKSKNLDVASDSQIKLLYKDVGKLKNQLNIYKSQYKSMQSDYERISEKVKCKTQNVSSNNDNIKSKNAELKNKQKNARNFKLPDFS